MVWMRLGLKAHIDIARVEPYALLTMPLTVPLLIRRIAARQSMITETQKQKRQLIAQIAEAFDAVPYPGDDNLYEGGQRDLVPQRKPPKGRSNPLLHDLIFCSPAAWHFFLPPHLSLMLRSRLSSNKQREQDEALKDIGRSRRGRVAERICNNRLALERIVASSPSLYPPNDRHQRRRVLLRSSCRAVLPMLFCPCCSRQRRLFRGQCPNRSYTTDVTRITVLGECLWCVPI